MADFKDIIGQEHIKKNLLSAIAKNKPSHAYIIAGEQGNGRTMLTEAFIKTLLCTGNIEKKHSIRFHLQENPSDLKAVLGLDACDICKSCLQSESHNNPDVTYVTHEGASISVDDIREQVNNRVDIKPLVSDYKIFVIRDADKMTEEAQNALLKTIEEPPEYVIIILISENENTLLSTILSRCVVLKTRPIDKKTIAEYLSNTLQMEPYSAEIAANFCQGNMGRAIHFAGSENFIELKNSVLSLMKRIDSMLAVDIVDAINKIAEDRQQINDYLDLMLLWYRDILMFKVTKDANILLYKDEYSAISEQASKRGYEDIEHIIDGISTAKLRLAANVNFETAIELMLLNIKDGC
ncbi:MAG: DNA polymerase III subunit [Lachnospiraceae bacterium]|nr:DNA polymerase III subunit [Lachnospiraceae bacterium]